MNEIFSIYRAAVRLITFDGAENVHRIMAEAFTCLNTNMSELDLYLTQALPAVRFTINETL